MSDTKRAEAVLKVVPSSKAIEWLKRERGADWRRITEEKLSDHLECLALGGEDVCLSAEVMAGLTGEERGTVIFKTEYAAEEAADEIRAQNRLAELSAYTTAELRAALEAAGKGEA